MGTRQRCATSEILKRYGLRQTIADTIGSGRIMRGLRTIPVMIEMADEMAERCPEGLLLNYTDPMAMVPWGSGRLQVACRAERSASATACATRTRSSRRLVGVPEDRIAFRTAGFNHQCFVYEFRDAATDEDL